MFSISIVTMLNCINSSFSIISCIISVISSIGISISSILTCISIISMRSVVSISSVTCRIIISINIIVMCILQSISIKCITCSDISISLIISITCISSSVHSIRMFSVSSTGIIISIIILIMRITIHKK